MRLSILFLFLFFYNGCSSQKPSVTPECDCDPYPWYYCCQPVDSVNFYGVGEKEAGKRSLAKTGAIQDGTFQIALSVHQMVKGALKNYEQCSGIYDCLDFIEKVQKTIVDTELTGTVVKYAHPIEGKKQKNSITIVSLVQYPRVNVIDDVDNAVTQDNTFTPSEKALWNEFKASQAFEALEKELK